MSSQHSEESSSNSDEITIEHREMAQDSSQGGSDNSPERRHNVGARVRSNQPAVPTIRAPLNPFHPPDGIDMMGTLMGIYSYGWPSRSGQNNGEGSNGNSSPRHLGRVPDLSFTSGHINSSASNSHPSGSTHSAVPGASSPSPIRNTAFLEEVSRDSAAHQRSPRPRHSPNSASFSASPGRQSAIMRLRSALRRVRSGRHSPTQTASSPQPRTHGVPNPSEPEWEDLDAPPTFAAGAAQPPAYTYATLQPAVYVQQPILQGIYPQLPQQPAAPAMHVFAGEQGRAVTPESVASLEEHYRRERGREQSQARPRAAANDDDGGTAARNILPRSPRQSNTTDRALYHYCSGCGTRRSLAYHRIHGARRGRQVPNLCRKCRRESGDLDDTTSDGLRVNETTVGDNQSLTPDFMRGLPDSATAISGRSSATSVSSGLRGLSPLGAASEASLRMTNSTIRRTHNSSRANGEGVRSASQSSGNSVPSNQPRNVSLAPSRSTRADEGRAAASRSHRRRNRSVSGSSEDAGAIRITSGSRNHHRRRASNNDGVTRNTYRPPTVESVADSRAGARNIVSEPERREPTTAAASSADATQSSPSIPGRTSSSAPGAVNGTRTEENAPSIAVTSPGEAENARATLADSQSVNEHTARRHRSEDNVTTPRASLAALHGENESNITVRQVRSANDVSAQTGPSLVSDSPRRDQETPRQTPAPLRQVHFNGNVQAQHTSPTRNYSYPMDRSYSPSSPRHQTLDGVAHVHPQYGRAPHLPGGNRRDAVEEHDPSYYVRSAGPAMSDSDYWQARRGSDFPIRPDPGAFQHHPGFSPRTFSVRTVESRTDGQDSPLIGTGIGNRQRAPEILGFPPDVDPRAASSPADWTDLAAASMERLRGAGAYVSGRPQSASGTASRAAFAQPVGLAEPTILPEDLGPSAAPFNFDIFSDVSEPRDENGWRGLSSPRPSAPPFGFRRFPDVSQPRGGGGWRIPADSGHPREPRRVFSADGRYKRPSPNSRLQENVDPNGRTAGRHSYPQPMYYNSQSQNAHGAHDYNWPAEDEAGMNRGRINDGMFYQDRHVYDHGAQPRRAPSRPREWRGSLIVEEVDGSTETTCDVEGELIYEASD